MVHSEIDDGTEKKPKDCTTVSAPGKVLIAGGYLILKSENCGLVLATSARFYSTVCLVQEHIQHDSHIHTCTIGLQVLSPQFKHSRQYNLSIDQEKQCFALRPVRSNEVPNPYVENAIQYALSVVQIYHSWENLTMRVCGWHEKGQSLRIILRGDNDFYSQSDMLVQRQLELSRQNFLSLPRFASCVTGSETYQQPKKTGLGSSAALISSLVGALLDFFGVVEQDAHDSSKGISSASLNIIHNTAQLAHASAQGKVGSGFDVSAAIYGSQKYSRFAARQIERLLDVNQLDGEELARAISEVWDCKREPFTLPAGLDLIMGDVNCGASTPGMVKKILTWLETDPSAPAIWSDLQASIGRLNACFSALTKLSKSDRDTYVRTLSEGAALDPKEWLKLDNSVGQTLVGLRNTFLHIRQQLRLMGSKASVGIEPESQEELADATMSLRGVLIAGVPGAGGGDAIFAIVMSVAAKQSVEDMWLKRGQGFLNRVFPLTLGLETSGGGIELVNDHTFDFNSV